MIAKALVLKIRNHTKDFCTYKDSCLRLYLVIPEALLNTVHIKEFLLQIKKL